jgi:hypothetical protein
MIMVVNDLFSKATTGGYGPLLSQGRPDHSANDRHGKQSLKKIAHLRLIKLSQV